MSDIKTPASGKRHYNMSRASHDRVECPKCNLVFTRKFLLRHLVEKHRIGQHAANKLVKELNVVIYAEDHPLSPNPQALQKTYEEITQTRYHIVDNSYEMPKYDKLIQSTVGSTLRTRSKILRAWKANEEDLLDESENVSRESLKTTSMSKETTLKSLHYTIVTTLRELLAEYQQILRSLDKRSQDLLTTGDNTSSSCIQDNNIDSSNEVDELQEDLQNGDDDGEVDECIVKHSTKDKSKSRKRKNKKRFLSDD